MTIFYIDTEFNEGNLYLGDIFEIACLSSSSIYSSSIEYFIAI